MLVSGTESGILAGEREIQWGDDEDLDFADLDWSEETVEEDDRDLSWAAVLKRTFESFVRGERPNLYGEWIDFDTESRHE
jgi:WD repeat and SOF domain-containing protein 1